MKVCSKCKELKPITEFSPRKDRVGKYLSACKDCRTNYYKNKRFPSSRLTHLCKEDSIRWHKEKRDRRTKEATLSIESEWDLFFFQEIHILRRMRNKQTNIIWHVDHIVPLHNKRVCGLHYWKNMQLLPAMINWRKNNAFYD